MAFCAGIIRAKFNATALMLIFLWCRLFIFAAASEASQGSSPLDTLKTTEYNQNWLLGRTTEPIEMPDWEDDVLGDVCLLQRLQAKIQAERFYTGFNRSCHHVNGQLLWMSQYLRKLRHFLYVYLANDQYQHFLLALNLAQADELDLNTPAVYWVKSERAYYTFYMHMAVASPGPAQLYRELLRRGADPQQRDSSGLSAIDAALQVHNATAVTVILWPESYDIAKFNLVESIVYQNFLTTQQCLQLDLISFDVFPRAVLVAMLSRQGRVHAAPLELALSLGFRFRKIAVVALLMAAGIRRRRVGGTGATGLQHPHK